MVKNEVSLSLLLKDKFSKTIEVISKNVESFNRVLKESELNAKSLSVGYKKTSRTILSASDSVVKAVKVYTTLAKASGKTVTALENTGDAITKAFNFGNIDKAATKVEETLKGIVDGFKELAVASDLKSLIVPVKNLAKNLKTVVLGSAEAKTALDLFQRVSLPFKIVNNELKLIGGRLLEISQKAGTTKIALDAFYGSKRKLQSLRIGLNNLTDSLSSIVTKSGNAFKALSLISRTTKAYKKAAVDVISLVDALKNVVVNSKLGKKALESLSNVRGKYVTLKTSIQGIGTRLKTVVTDSKLLTSALSKIGSTAVESFRKFKDSSSNTVTKGLEAIITKSKAAVASIVSVGKNTLSTISSFFKLERTGKKTGNTLVSSFNKFKDSIKTIRTNLRGLSRTLSSIVGRQSRFLLAIVSIATIKNALDVASKQVQSERAVLASLEGQVALQEKLLDLSNEIQKKSTFNDEDLLRQEAILLRMGIAAQDIPAAIQAAVDTSVALGSALELTTRAIAQGLLGETPLLLTRRLPFLRELQREGKLTTEIINSLTEAFGGAAEALVDTEFGKYQQGLNLLADRFEEIGKVLIKFVLPLQDAFIQRLDRFIEITKEAKLGVLLEVFRSWAPELLKIAGILTAIVTSLVFAQVFITSFAIIGTFLTAVVTGLSAIAALIGPLGALGGFLFAGLTTGVSRATGVFEGLIEKLLNYKEIVTSTASNITKLFAEIRAGKKPLSDIKDVLAEIFGTVKDIFSGVVGNPIAEISKSLLQAATGLFKAISASAETAINKIFFYLERKTAVLYGIGEEDAFDSGKRAIDKILDYRKTILDEKKNLVEQDQIISGDDAEEVKVNARRIRAEITENIKFYEGLKASQVKDLNASLQDNSDEVNRLLTLYSKIGNSTIEAKKGFIALATSFDTTFTNIGKSIEKAKDAADDIGPTLEKLFNKDNTAFLLDKVVTADLEIGSLEIDSEKIDDSIADLRKAILDTKLDVDTLFDDLSTEKITKLLTTFPVETTKAVSRALTSEIKRQLDDGLISVKDFLDFSKTLSNTVNDKSKADAAGILSDREESIRLLKEELVLAEAKTAEILTQGKELKALSADQLDFIRAIDEAEGSSEKKDFSKRVFLGRQGILKEDIEDILRFQEELKKARQEENGFRQEVKGFTRSILDAQEKTNALNIEGLELDGKRLNAARVLGEEFLTQAREARTDLEKRRREVANLQATGTFFGNEFAEEQKNLDIFSNSIASLRERLEQIKISAPGAAIAIDLLLQKLTVLESQAIGKGGITDPGYWQGFLDFWKRFGLSVKDATVELSNMQLLAIELGDVFVNSLADQLVDSIFKVGKSWKEFYKDFILLIGKMIVKALILKLVMDAIKGIGNLFDSSPGQGLDFDSNPGQYGPGFNSGGPVPGARTHADTVNAKLTPGEYVLNEASSNTIGLPILNWLNSLRSKADLSQISSVLGLRKGIKSGITRAGRGHYATGGSVSSAASPVSSSQSGGAAMPVIAGSKQTMDQLLAGGGENAIWDLLGRNRNLARSILGV